MYKKIIKASLFAIIFLGISLLRISAQETGDDMEEAFVSKTFYATSLIHTQTVETIPLKQLKFTIYHRFGEASLKENLIKDFLGMDLSANIRFGFQVPLSKDLYIGVGRTKFKKQYDFEIKYAVFKQRIDDRIPFSFSIYGNTSISSDDFPDTPEGFLFLQSDSLSVFNYNFKHRLAYNYQLIFARKFNRWLSLQVAPQLSFRNLVNLGDENMMISIPMGARFKVAMLSSILIEYMPLLNSNRKDAVPMGIAYEVGTPGHSFQFLVCNSSYIVSPYIYSNETSRLREGNFFLGFNIHRYLWLKN